MVGYGEQLKVTKVVEWRNYYVSYDVLKDLLRDIVRDEKAHEEFLRALENNIALVSQFYERQEVFCERQVYIAINDSVFQHQSALQIASRANSHESSHHSEVRGRQSHVVESNRSSHNFEIIVSTINEDDKEDESSATETVKANAKANNVGNVQGGQFSGPSLFPEEPLSETTLGHENDGLVSGQQEDDFVFRSLSGSAQLPGVPSFPRKNHGFVYPSPPRLDCKGNPNEGEENAHFRRSNTGVREGEPGIKDQLQDGSPEHMRARGGRLFSRGATIANLDAHLTSNQIGSGVGTVGSPALSYDGHNLISQVFPSSGISNASMSRTNLDNNATVDHSGSILKVKRLITAIDKLMSFASTNLEAVRKICKKYDKEVNSSDDLLQKIEVHMRIQMLHYDSSQSDEDAGDDDSKGASKGAFPTVREVGHPGDKGSDPMDVKSTLQKDLLECIGNTRWANAEVRLGLMKSTLQDHLNVLESAGTVGGACPDLKSVSEIKQTLKTLHPESAHVVTIALLEKFVQIANVDETELEELRKQTIIPPSPTSHLMKPGDISPISSKRRADDDMEMTLMPTSATGVGLTAAGKRMTRTRSTSKDPVFGGARRGSLAAGGSMQLGRTPDLNKDLFPKAKLGLITSTARSTATGLGHATDDDEHKAGDSMKLPSEEHDHDDDDEKREEFFLEGAQNYIMKLQERHAPQLPKLPKVQLNPHIVWFFFALAFSFFGFATKAVQTFEDNAAEVPSWQPWTTIFVTLVVLECLVMEVFDSDLVLIGATLALTLFQVLDLTVAWQGYSNDVVLSVAVLGIVARGVENSGAVEKIFLYFLGKPKAFTEAILRLLVPAIVLNIGVSNTANMSILMPIIEKWSDEIGWSKNFFLMPLSYTLLISGTVAIFATSSNLIAQGQMERYGQTKFTTFEIAPVSICATFVCVITIVILVPKLFADFQEDVDDPGDENVGDVEGDASKTNIIGTVTPLQNQSMKDTSVTFSAKDPNTSMSLAPGASPNSLAEDLKVPLLENHQSFGSSRLVSPISGAAGGGSLLTRKSGTTKSVRERKDTKRYIITIQLVSQKFTNKKLSEQEKLFKKEHVMRIERLGTSIPDFDQPDFRLQFYDILQLYTTASEVLQLNLNPAVTILTRENGDSLTYKQSDHHEVVEIVLDSACPLVKTPICGDNLLVRKLYGGRVLAIRPISFTQVLKGALTLAFNLEKIRETVRQYLRQELKQRKYELGDTLIVLTREGFIDSNAGSSEFLGIRLLHGRRQTEDDDDEDDGHSSISSAGRLTKSNSKQREEKMVKTEEITDERRAASQTAAGAKLGEAKTGVAGQFQRLFGFNPYLLCYIFKAIVWGDASDLTKDQQTQFKRVMSLVILLTMILCVSTSVLELLTACMSAVFALAWVGCMTKEQAFSAIKIRTVNTIVGAFGLGAAIGNTKVAYVIATEVTTVMSPFGEIGLLFAIYIVTVLLGIVFHATAVVILMFPVCLESAIALDVSVHRAVCILMIGAGGQMLSPVSYQTNLMAFSAGGYEFNDFAKLGAPIVTLMGLVAVPTTIYFIE